MYKPTLYLLSLLSMLASCKTIPTNSTNATTETTDIIEPEIKVFLNTEKLIEICNAVSDEFDREMCFENTAIFMKKVELCKYSGSPGFCIEDVDVNKDIEMSKLITVCEGHSDEAYCFYDLAYHRGDKSLCERAGDMEDICNEEWDEYN